MSKTAKLMARTVLDDCRWALKSFKGSTSGGPLRINWVAVVTLLRAVGHVLSKVDASHDPDVKDASERDWDQINSTKPEPDIFWEFIESERNNVVKQYEFGFARTIELSRTPLGQSHITQGPFQGRSELEVAQEAIEWWEQYLQKIEESVERKKSGTP